MKWENKPIQQQKQNIATDVAKNPFKYCDKLHFPERWFKSKYMLKL